MKRHPGKQELMGYAESVVDGGAISAKMAGHLAGCPACRAEFEAMRAALEFTRKTPALDYSDELTAQILIAARKERVLQHNRRLGRTAAFALGKGVGYAAAILLIGLLSFGAALHSLGRTPALQAALPHAESAYTPAPVDIRKTTADIQTLASAMSSPSRHAPSVWEREHRRAVTELGTDIEAARAALARNPGCLRASRIVDANLERQARTLRDLYVERSL